MCDTIRLALWPGAAEIEADIYDSINWFTRILPYLVIGVGLNLRPTVA